MRLSISHVHESSLHISRLKAQGPPHLRQALEKWCGREDSNPTGAMPTATSTLRVTSSATTAVLRQPLQLSNYHNVNQRRNSKPYRPGQALHGANL